MARKVAAPEVVDEPKEEVEPEYHYEYDEKHDHVIEDEEENEEISPCQHEHLKADQVEEESEDENEVVYKESPPNGGIIAAVIFFTIMVGMAFYLPKWYKGRNEKKIEERLRMEREMDDYSDEQTQDNAV